MKRFALLLCVAVLLAGFSATAANVTLTMQAVSGQGTTTPVSPGTYTYTKGTTITLTATAAPGWQFVNWTGSSTTTANPFTLKMSANKTYRANFQQTMYTLTTSVVGSGTVTPAGSTQYAPGTVVNVSAQAAQGWRFDHWEGALTGSTNPTTITMNANKSVTGVFVAQYTLTMAAGAGGTTTPAPGPHVYDTGTPVQVTAIPNTGYVFVAWSGSLTGSTNPATVVMDANKSVTATFAVAPPQVTLTLTATPGGTLNPSVGVHSYSEGTPVQISATPTTGYVFVGWTGDLTGVDNPATVTMDANMTINAIFSQDPATALRNYVNTPDSNYAWSQYSSRLAFPYTEYYIDMTSQAWRSSSEVDRPLWQHWLILVKPWFGGDTCVLLVDGGDNGGTPPTETLDPNVGLLATITGQSVGQVKMIPNQPLYFPDYVDPYTGNPIANVEDEILAYSFNKAVYTGDLNWIVLFPMVKATVRAMDTCHAKVSAITTFIVVGGSKRGWTTWLLGSLQDPRVIGIAPLVIDILNMEANVDNIWASYGYYPRAMRPYVDPWDIFIEMKRPEADVVQRALDPYTYFASGAYDTLPKLFVYSGGDQFFCQDGDHLYWDDIPGPKYYRRIPNCPHELSGPGETAIQGVAYWAQKVKNHSAIQSYTWTFEANGSIRVQIGSPTPTSVKLWQVTNPKACDFKLEDIGAAWTSSTLTNQGGGVYIGYCPPPPTGYTCFLVEMDYGNSEIFTTQARITPEVKPYAGEHGNPIPPEIVFYDDFSDGTAQVPLWLGDAASDNSVSGAIWPSLVRLGWKEDGTGTSVENGAVVTWQCVDGTASGTIAPDVNFTKSGSIWYNRNFTIHVEDLNPVVGGGGVSSNWAAVNAWQRAQAGNGTGQEITRGDTFLGVLFRDNGSLAVWSKGVNVSGEIVFDAAPADQVYDIDIVVTNISGYIPHSSFDYAVLVNGVSVTSGTVDDVDTYHHFISLESWQNASAASQFDVTVH
jgi:uncharacterized repeat protein (TIGR02543 family)